ncbi:MULTISPECIES: hypothetical protein [Micromonospora]|uniref:Uncharacterized protein n=1 Tax=Micromonospora yangpuensis TaxID=683228 RepID=A0A1C6VI65_9ACTN|nr:hypothetical protein [Micromonospora yangpuensis]GGM00171.1 hypothetical protein GCM10012279_17170 [Micromonospora yangpuensis]SCL66019.1 hypothetical protein GA0070617_5934 [Micromonospora yangpuensis]
MPEKFSVEKRKEHVLAWAEASLAEEKSKTAYARENNISPTSLHSWINDANGASFTIEEKELVNRARRVADLQTYSPAERKQHVAEWVKECLKKATPINAYAEMNGFSNTTLKNWINGKGVTFTPAEQELINQAKRAISKQTYSAEERIEHAVSWAKEGTARGTTTTDYATRNNIAPGTLRSWVYENSGVIFTPAEQELINQAKQATERTLPVEARIKHALGWAAESIANETTMAEYAAENGILTATLRSWVNGSGNVTFTPEQQATINQAKRAASQRTYSAEERIEHAISWAQEGIARGTTMTEYAARNDLAFHTLNNWIHGRSVTFTPEQQATIDQAKKLQARPAYSAEERMKHVSGWSSENSTHGTSVIEYAAKNGLAADTLQRWVHDRQNQATPEEKAQLEKERHATDVANANSMVARAAGSRMRKYTWMTSAGAGASSSAAEPPAKTWHSDRNTAERRSQSPRS